MIVWQAGNPASTRINGQIFKFFNAQAHAYRVRERGNKGGREAGREGEKGRKRGKVELGVRCVGGS